MQSVNVVKYITHAKNPVARHTLKHNWKCTHYTNKNALCKIRIIAMQSVLKGTANMQRKKK